MKDQIDVTVRRSPKYSVFIGLGAIVGILVAGILTLTVDPAQMPAGYTVAKGAGLLLLFLGIIGAFLGGLVAILLDRLGRRRARKYTVEAHIEMVDDPKEVARRRLAEMRGEDPDQPSTAAAPNGHAAPNGREAEPNGDAAEETAQPSPTDEDPRR